MPNQNAFLDWPMMQAKATATSPHSFSQSIRDTFNTPAFLLTTPRPELVNPQGDLGSSAEPPQGKRTLGAAASAAGAPSGAWKVITTAPAAAAAAVAASHRHTRRRGHGFWSRRAMDDMRPKHVTKERACSDTLSCKLCNDQGFLE